MKKVKCIKQSELSIKYNEGVTDKNVDRELLK